MLGSVTAVGNGRGSHGSLKSLPRIGSTGAFGSMHSSKSSWHAAAAALGLSGAKSSRRMVLGMCLLVMTGCLFSSLSVLRLGQPGSSSSSGSWMMQREPTLKLMVASKLHSAQQAAGLITEQQRHAEFGALGRIPVQHQQPVLLQQQEGGAGAGVGEPGSSLQPASGQSSDSSAVLNTWQDYKQQYIGKAGRRHTRPTARQRQSQPQQQQQSSLSSAAAGADVQQLPLPQSLQEKLLQRQVATEPAYDVTAAAGAGADKAASDFLQALELTDSKPQGAAQQQQHQQLTNDAAAAGAELHLNNATKQKAGYTAADVAASIASAAGTVHAGLDPVDTTSTYIMQRGQAPTRLKYPLWWHGPMWSGSGYGGGKLPLVSANSPALHYDSPDMCARLLAMLWRPRLCIMRAAPVSNAQ
jgi:hypothetical protein